MITAISSHKERARLFYTVFQHLDPQRLCRQPLPYLGPRPQQLDSRQLCLNPRLSLASQNPAESLQVTTANATHKLNSNTWQDYSHRLTESTVIMTVILPDLCIPFSYLLPLQEPWLLLCVQLKLSKGSSLFLKIVYK